VPYKTMDRDPQRYIYQRSMAFCRAIVGEKPQNRSGTILIRFGMMGEVNSGGIED
jgi:hypothetical protein